MPPPLPPTTGSRLAKVGLWLQLAPLIGLSETLQQLWALYREMLVRIQTGGVALDITSVSKLMKAATTGSMAGTLISCLGAALILLAYTKFNYQPRWAFWFLVSFVILGLLSMPMM